MAGEDLVRVLTEATIENLQDLWEVERKLIPAAKARRIVVRDALVNTKSIFLSMPRSMIEGLGLTRFGTRRITSSLENGEAGIYEAVRLTIQGRTCTMDVIEVPDGVPVLIGQIPLEHLDFVVNMKNHTLIGNPAHGGEHMYEAYSSISAPG